MTDYSEIVFHIGLTHVYRNVRVGLPGKGDHIKGKHSQPVFVLPLIVKIIQFSQNYSKYSKIFKIIQNYSKLFKCSVLRLNNIDIAKMSLEPLLVLKRQ